MEDQKENPNSKFIEEFLVENPTKTMLSEIGIVLSDYIKAYTLMNEKGDLPSAAGRGFPMSSFQNCLLITFSERTFGNMKSIN